MERSEFWLNVAYTNDTSECWPWKLGKDKNGYGKVRIDGEKRGAHRIAYELFYKITPGLAEVLHRCDNPPCCNPAHLFLGTTQDNTADRHKKGRSARGECHCHKLTQVQVDAIRDTYSQGGIRQKDLANCYGVSQVMISRIIRRKAWFITRGQEKAR